MENNVLGGEEKSTDVSKDTGSDGLKIGGWLILFAIGVVISPFRIGYQAYTVLASVFQPGVWETLTTPGSEAYHQLWAPLLIGEAVGNTLFVLVSGALIYLFFARKKIVPVYVAVYLLSNAAFITADFFLADLIPFVKEQQDPKALTEMIRVIIGCAIWVPYFLVSKRVKATFVK